MMRDTRMVCFSAIALALTGWLGGCPTPSCESGDPAALAAAAEKLANCRMMELSACELKLAAKLANEASDEIDQELTDEEANAAVDFIKANNLNCIEDLQALYECVQRDPNCATIPDSLQKLIDEDKQQ